MPTSPKGQIPPLGKAIYDGPRVSLTGSVGRWIPGGGTLRPPRPWERQVITRRGKWHAEAKRAR